MRCFLVVLVVGATAVLGNNVPPLATHDRADTPSHDPPVVPQVNWGLHGAVTEELWEEPSLPRTASDVYSPAFFLFPLHTPLARIPLPHAYSSI
ncbi:hypothetical protein E2C01_100286 [Portunus trituberculatus]|uniref:Secreted protein n=1 Tax=Portunus trituberculatus TaxID=210409 RepID=A0A5B7KBM8_PORTR|nr:hypothetical protein [Portunus trituberculatus]